MAMVICVVYAPVSDAEAAPGLRQLWTTAPTESFGVYAMSARAGRVAILRIAFAASTSLALTYSVDVRDTVTGAKLASWDLPEIGRRTSAGGISMSPDGQELVVLQGGAGRVTRFDLEGRMLSTWSITDDNPSESIALDVSYRSSGVVLMSTTRGLRRYTPDGSLLNTVRTFTSGYLTSNAAGAVWAVAGGTDVRRINGSGNVSQQLSIGARRDLDEHNDSNAIAGLAVRSDGSLWINDLSFGSVSLYSPQGRLLGSCDLRRFRTSQGAMLTDDGAGRLIESDNDSITGYQATDDGKNCRPPTIRLSHVSLQRHKQALTLSYTLSHTARYASVSLERSTRVDCETKAPNSAGRCTSWQSVGADVDLPTGSGRHVVTLGPSKSRKKLQAGSYRAQLTVQRNGAAQADRTFSPFLFAASR